MKARLAVGTPLAELDNVDTDRDLQRQRHQRAAYQPPGVAAQEAAPDIVGLQELKAPDDKFPAAALRSAGYGAIWHGQKSWNGVAVLACGAEPVETRRGLPGDPDDTHSRHIEAAIGGMVVGCLYLPNGNPAPGPKFDYKLLWFERLTSYAKALLESGAPAVLPRQARRPKEG
jgi:exodeoxyribonuclease III